MEDLWDGLIGSLRTKTCSRETNTSFWTSEGARTHSVTLPYSQWGHKPAGDRVRTQPFHLLALACARAMQTLVFLFKRQNGFFC